MSLFRAGEERLVRMNSETERFDEGNDLGSNLATTTLVRDLLRDRRFAGGDPYIVSISPINATEIADELLEGEIQRMKYEIRQDG
jgi:hypothetical protein